MAASENSGSTGSVARWRDLLLLLVAFGALYFFRLGSYPLSNPDEGRNAEVSREMLASGDWVTPRLNHVNYFEKPPLVYWITAASEKIFGLNEWSVRAVPVLFALAGILLTYAAGRELYGRTAGLIAAIVLGTSLLWFIVGHIPILDTAMSVFMSATLFCFVLGVREPPGSRRRWFFLGLYASAALATLTKGLMGFLVTGAVMFLWLLVFDQWKRLRPLYLPAGVLLFLAISAPWHVLAALRNETWVHRYIVFEHFLRFLTPVASRTGPVHYFVWILLAGLIPWVGFLWPALRDQLRGGWARRKENAIAWFLVTWAVFIFFFFSISKSKLPPYILPIFPALAVLIGAWLARALADQATARLRAGLRVFSFVCGLLAVALAAVMTRPDLVKMDAAQALALRIPAGALIAILFTGGIIIPALTRLRGVRTAIVGITVMIGAFFVALQFAAPALNKPGTKDLALWVKAHARPEDRVFHCYDFYQDFTFYAERFVGIVGSNHAELELDEDAAARTSGRFITDVELRQQWPDAGRIFLVVQPRKIAEIKKSYGDAIAVWQRRAAAARTGGAPFSEPRPEPPLFADPGFHYHLIVQTAAYYLLSNQP
jgi:4-amino-4-deoxy-L-arabinose transferase-like glycosyltransferase